jgi:transcriptional regulator with XRE-family HTH domain
MRHPNPKEHIMQTVIGQNIRKLRGLNSWTQEHLAEAASVTSRTVQRAEAGEPLGAESLQALAGALNTTLEELRRDQDEEAVQRYLARFARVTLQPLVAGPELLALMPSAAAVLVEASSSDLAVRHADAIAVLRDSLVDLLDVWGELAASQQLDQVRALRVTLQTVMDAGGRVSVGMYNAKVPTPPGQPEFQLQTLVVLIATEAVPMALIDPRKVSLGL